MKKLLTICATLIAFASYSQDIIEITPDQAKEAIKNAQHIPILESEIQSQGLIISSYKNIEESLRAQVDNMQQRLSLWEENYNILETRYQAEKAVKQKSTWFRDVLIGLGLLAAGFTAGVLVN